MLEPIQIFYRAFLLLVKGGGLKKRKEYTNTVLYKSLFKFDPKYKSLEGGDKCYATS